MTTEPSDVLWDDSQDEAFTQDLPPEFFEDLLPNNDAEDEGDTRRTRGQFLYIGKGLKPDEFAAYVREYTFGSQPPSFVVIHHTAVPDTQHARHKHGTWDANEGGLSEQQIYTKRLRQLTGIKNYYQNQLGWGVGPHLFIDERYIWLFSPMYYQGIHAAAGNGNGRGVYSVGIEVVGNYTSVRWPEPVERLVGFAVAVLKQQLNTFELVHKPMAGGISGHRDYNKPSCPGNAVTTDYYMGVLQREWQRFQAGDSPAAQAKPVPTIALAPDMPIIGPASGTQRQVSAFVQSRLPGQSEYINDVDLIMGYYWRFAPPVGVDPFLAACQCVFETDALRSDWAARPRRNPAGLGVRQEGGLSFATWEASVQAHIGQLLALALRDEESNEAQRAMMQQNPRHSQIGPDLRGTVRTLNDLNKRWTADSGYAAGLLNRMKAIRG